MTEIIYVNEKMEVTKRRNTERKKMEFSGGMSVTIHKAELCQHYGIDVWHGDDHDKHPSLKMRRGRMSARRQLNLYGTVNDSQFLKEHRPHRNTMYSNDPEIYQKELEQDYHLNRFQNEIIQIDCSNYSVDTNQFNMFGHFHCHEGLSMNLQLPDDVFRFLYQNKKTHNEIEAYFCFHRKWAHPVAPEDFEEPYYKNPNSFSVEVTRCAFTFWDKFGNKTNVDSTNKNNKQTVQ